MVIFSISRHGMARRDLVLFRLAGLFNWVSSNVGPHTLPLLWYYTSSDKYTAPVVGGDIPRGPW